MLGWCADLIRGIWGLWYWNGRKSLFRLRGAAGPCPCQNLSDTGKAGMTGCDAALHWTEPKRFRHICPLLRPNAKGEWRCSVDATDVRPFWGRFFFWHGSAVVAAYLVGTSVIFGGLQKIGYDVRWLDVAWPQRWDEITRARADYFKDRAKAAFARRDPASAASGLELAHHYDPDDLEIGLMLAQIWQVARPEQANRIYSHLLQIHPTQASTVAETWFRALLNRGDFGLMQELSARALVLDPARSPIWLHALLFAQRRTGDSEIIPRLLTQEDTLSPEAVRVLSLQQQVNAAPDPQSRVAVLRVVEDSQKPGTYEIHFRVRSLLQLNAGTEAVTLLSRHEAALNDRDRIALQLDAFAQLGYDRSRRALIGQLLPLLPQPAAVDLLTTHLIRHPETTFFRQLLARCEPILKSPTPEDYNTLIALYCVAAASQDETQRQFMAERIQASTDTRFSTLDAVERYFSAGAPGPIGSVLPILKPANLDLVYALLDRFEPAEKTETTI